MTGRLSTGTRVRILTVPFKGITGTIVGPDLHQPYGHQIGYRVDVDTLPASWGPNTRSTRDRWPFGFSDVEAIDP
jgi:hypothetical protein